MYSLILVGDGNEQETEWGDRNGEGMQRYQGHISFLIIYMHLLLFIERPFRRERSEVYEEAIMELVWAGREVEEFISRSHELEFGCEFKFPAINLPPYIHTHQ